MRKTYNYKENQHVFVNRNILGYYLKRVDIAC